jgi:hypothetical protein
VRGASLAARDARTAPCKKMAPMRSTCEPCAPRAMQTVGCREREAIVSGLLFTMKIPTIACGPQTPAPERGHDGVTGTECLLRLCRVRLHVMTPRQRETFPPVTLGHIRGHGCRNILVYCTSGWCNHSVVMNADGLPDEMPVRSLCPRMVCTACGLIGADVRPDWSPVTNRRPS